MEANSMIPACHRCGKLLQDDLEHQESMLIHFRAGYGSVFGDGNVVTSHLCQYCVQEVLGQWLTIQCDDPFEPKVKLRKPMQAFQPSQLSDQVSGESFQRPSPSKAELEKIFAQLKDPDSIWEDY